MPVVYSEAINHLVPAFVLVSGSLITSLVYIGRNPIGKIACQMPAVLSDNMVRQDTWKENFRVNLKPLLKRTQLMVVATYNMIIIIKRGAIEPYWEA